MKTMELYDKTVEIAKNQTSNSVVFGILQLNSLVEKALSEGLSAEKIDEVMSDALNSCGKIYL